MNQRTQTPFLWNALAPLVFAMLLFRLAPAEAQLLPSQQVGLPQDQVSVVLSPSIPGPNQTVSAKAESYSTHLDRATISWYVNGKLISQGLGKTALEFETGDVGKATSISLQATLSSGESIQKNLTILPQEVDVILESPSYTHPFYKGKSLPPPNSPISLIAVPNFKTSGGQTISDRNLIYTWNDSGTVLGNQSGTGKNTLTITGPQVYRTKNITVTVRSQDGSLQAVRSLTVSPTTSVVQMYRIDPLLGVLFENALTGTKPIKGSEVAILVEPFFFSTNTRVSDNIAYSWSLNGSGFQNPSGDASVLALRPSGSGQARLGIRVSGVQSYLENANQEVTLTFNNEE